MCGQKIEQPWIYSVSRRTAEVSTELFTDCCDKAVQNIALSQMVVLVTVIGLPVYLKSYIKKRILTN